MRFLSASLLGFLLLYVGAWSLADRIWPKRDPSYSSVVYARSSELLRAYLSEDEKWRLPVSVENLPSHVTSGLLCLEDRRFWSHPGIDPFSVVRALRQNIAAGEVVSGASTITMQLMRLFKPKKRHLSAKVKEAVNALFFELVTSKEKILNLYLSYAPFGRNIEGLSSASYVLYGVAPNQLTPAQTAALFLLPQAPSRLITLSDQEWQDSIESNLKRYLQCGVINGKEYLEAVAQIKPPKQRPLPMLAPHLADVLVAGYNETVDTTIELSIQRQLEDYVRRQQRNLTELDIHNIAVAVVENATGEVKGLIGNFNYDVKGSHGQMIPSFLARRSPGSTLKPFLYVKALEQGIIIPEMLLEDIPMNFNNYRPQNYSGRFSGLVTAEKALSDSLNLPFISLLQKVGVDYFASFLAAGGLRDMTPIDQIGLSLIVGGVEVNFLELTQLFVALSQNGKLRPLRLRQSDPELTSFQWLHHGAAALTRRSLGLRDRPDLPAQLASTLQTSGVFWKTGTSQGRRDAWSIGFNDRYTVAVWLGNLNQKPSSNLVGAFTAAPIMFDLLASVPKKSAIPPPSAASDHLIKRRVCALSGYRPAAGCHELKSVVSLKHRSPAALCPFHRRVLIDSASGLRLEPHCIGSRQTAFTSVLVWPERISDWLARNWLSGAALPVLHPACKQGSANERRFEISSPKDQSVHYLLKSMGSSKTFVPVEISRNELAARHRCFLNAKAIDLSQGFLELGVGSYDLYCLNALGNSASSKFRVESNYQSMLPL